MQEFIIVFVENPWHAWSTLVPRFAVQTHGLASRNLKEIRREKIQIVFVYNPLRDSNKPHGPRNEAGIHIN